MKTDLQLVTALSDIFLFLARTSSRRSTARKGQQPWGAAPIPAAARGCAGRGASRSPSTDGSRAASPPLAEWRRLLAWKFSRQRRPCPVGPSARPPGPTPACAARKGALLTRVAAAGCGRIRAGSRREP